MWILNSRLGVEWEYGDVALFQKLQVVQTGITVGSDCFLGGLDSFLLGPERSPYTLNICTICAIPHCSLLPTKLVYTYQMQDHLLIYLVAEGNPRQIFPVEHIQERIKIARRL
jgi:hypothetical protein